MAAIVNSMILEAEASEVVLIFLPEGEGIDQTLKGGKDQASKKIEVASKDTLEGSLEVAEVGLMLLASTTTTEINFHPEDLKMKKEVANINLDPTEAVVASEVEISQKEAVECTEEEAPSEAVSKKAMRTEVEEVISKEKEVATVVTEVAIVVKTREKEVASVVTEVATVVTEVATVVTEVATVVVTLRAKKAVAEEAATVVVAMKETRTEEEEAATATVVVAMREMRTEAVLEEDIIALAPLPPSLLHLPEEEAKLPSTAER